MLIYCIKSRLKLDYFLKKISLKKESKGNIQNKQYRKCYWRSLIIH